MARINKKEQQIINQGGSLKDIKNRLDRKYKKPLKPRLPTQEDRWWDIPGVTQGALNLMCGLQEEWDFNIGGCYGIV